MMKTQVAVRRNKAEGKGKQRKSEKLERSCARLTVETREKSKRKDPIPECKR